jgi:hypothetical protein
MQYTALAAVAALAVGAAVTAHAQNERSSLNALLAQWDRAGFSSPSKPGQYRVYGRDGYVTSGPGYNAMVSLIRSAVIATQEGRDRDAVTEIAQASRLLTASKREKV